MSKEKSVSAETEKCEELESIFNELEQLMTMGKAEKCKRKCFWELDGVCACGDEKVFQSETQYTDHCIGFDTLDFEEDYMNTYKECEKLLEKQNLDGLKKS